MTDRFSDVYGPLGELEHAIAIVKAAQDQITTLEQLNKLRCHVAELDRIGGVIEGRLKNEQD
jgi:hypothetical protein